MSCCSLPKKTVSSWGKILSDISVSPVRWGSFLWHSANVWWLAKDTGDCWSVPISAGHRLPTQGNWYRSLSSAYSSRDSPYLPSHPEIQFQTLSSHKRKICFWIRSPSRSKQGTGPELAFSLDRNSPSGNKSSYPGLLIIAQGDSSIIRVWARERSLEGYSVGKQWANSEGGV